MDNQLKDWSLESIAQQNTDYFNELTALFALYVGKTRKEIHDSSFATDLSDIIFKHTKIRMKVDIGNAANDSSDMGYSIVYYNPSSNNPTSYGSGIELQRLTKIRVNDKKATVEGDLSIFHIKLHVDISCLIQTTLIAEEHAAIVLHEIGHAYYGFAMVGRFARTNLALRDVTRDFNKLTDKQRTILITGAANELGLPEVDAAELAQAKDGGEVLLSFYTEQLYKIRSELGSDTYDRTMFEYMADQFATRHGAGRYLITGLDKLINGFSINKMYSDYVLKRSGIRYAFSIISIVVGTVTWAPVAVLGALSLVWTTFMLAINTSIYSMSSKGGYKYDQERERLARIRNQIQLRMRTHRLTEAEKRTYTSDLAALDEIIKRTENTGMLSFWLLRTYASHRKHISQAQLHMAYEQLGYNKLFDKAFALRNS